MKLRLLFLLLTVSLSVRLFGDRVDDAVTQLSSGESSAIHAALVELRDSRDARLIEPLWSILLGQDIAVRIRDMTVAQSHKVPLKPLARNLLANCQGDVKSVALKNLTSTNSVARREAAELLSRFSQPVPEALALLKASLRDNDPHVRLAAIRGLGNQGPPAIQSLLAHLKRVAKEPDLDEVSAVSDMLGRFPQDARTILPELSSYLDASKYREIVIWHVLRAVEPLGYARDTPEENWDLVLPALARLKRQAKEGNKQVPSLGRSLAIEIPERIEFRKKVTKRLPK